MRVRRDSRVCVKINKSHTSVRKKDGELPEKRTDGEESGTRVYSKDQRAAITETHIRSQRLLKDSSVSLFSSVC